MSELEFESEAPAPGSSDQRYDDAALEVFRRIADCIGVADAFDPDQIRDDHGRWASVGGLGSWQPPSDNNWRDVPGQNHKIYEPALPDLKTSYQFKHPVTGELKTVHGEKRLSSGVIMREPDGRTWLVKPKNGFGGYNYTFPKGGVEPDLSPQANAIKETYEESGLKARITGWAGDYHGDTSVTRMYHAVREAGHPKDHGWETESVTLVQPHEVNNYLNRSRDRKIAAHHIKDEYTEELHPRDKDGKWTSAGAQGFSKTLKEGDIPHKFVHQTEEGIVISVPHNHDLPSLEATAKSHGDFMHTGIGHASKFYTFAATAKGESTPAPHAELNMSDLTKISGKKGSNEGGVYAHHDDAASGLGTQYYIKTPKTQDHVQNELLAAKLYQLAGVRTMDYVPVAGGNHVATVLQPLEKNNIAHFNADERHEAQKDFATHAWLANWDAAGTGGDNQVIVNGKVHTVDTGGSLKYRAQGDPKGAAFGDKVTETQTLRDPSKNPDAAKLYGPMTNEQLIASMKNVISISNQDIAKTIYDPSNKMSTSDKSALLDKLIARKNDIDNQMDNLIAKQESINKSWESPPSPMAQAAKTVAEPVKDIPEHEFAKLSSADKVKHLLMKGTTTKELTTKLGWKSIGIPANAAALNLKLEKTQQNGVTHYKGIPMTAEEITTAKGEAKAAKAAKKAGAVAEPDKVWAEELKKTQATVTAQAENWKAILAKPHSESFQNELNMKGVSNGGITYHSNGRDLQISAPTPKAKEMAEVAKNHPEWTLNKGAQSTYTAPKSAFDDTKHLVPVEPTKAKLETGKPFVTAAGHDINTPLGSFKQSLEEHGVDYRQGTGNAHADYIDVNPTHALKAQEIAKWHPAVMMQSPETYVVAKNGIAPSQKPLISKAPPAIVHPPATAAELAKAQKNVALQLQYVPGAPDVPKAHELISEFNKKYAGKTLTTPEELQTKVNAFKDLTAAMVPLQSVQQQEAAAKQASLVAKAKEHAAKVAAKEAYEAANLHTLPDETQREFWLKKVTSNDTYLKLGKEAVEKYKYLKEHDVSPAEVGFIKAFTGSYSHVNENLRKGHMEEKEFAFKHIMQDALDKMPKHDGDTVYRKMTLDAAEIANYVPGQISEWKAFNSTSKNKDTWSGNAHFTIRNPKSGVDVQKISSHPSEAEVIMPANTFYKVLSKKQSGGVTHIEMEEIIPFTKKKKVA